MLKNYRKVAHLVKKIVKKFDPNAKIFVFGSVVKGKITAASDIDILIVTERIDLKYDMMVEVFRLIDAPIELHIVNEEKFKRWYLRFISYDELEEI